MNQLQQDQFGNIEGGVDEFSGGCGKSADRGRIQNLQ
jgi:hypothetical protein